MSIIQFPKSAIIRKTLEYEHEYDRERRVTLLTMHTNNTHVGFRLDTIFSYAEKRLRYKDKETFDEICSMLKNAKKSCAECFYAVKNCTKTDEVASNTCHKVNYINTGGLVLLTGETNHE